MKKCKNLAKKNTRQRDKQIEEDVAFVKQVPVHPKDRLARKVRDQFGDLETIDYNNDTNINDLVPKRTSGTQTAAKKIVNKNKNLSRKKKPYQRPPENNNTNISDLNDIASGTKKAKMNKLLLKK